MDTLIDSVLQNLATRRVHPAYASLYDVRKEETYQLVRHFILDQYAELQATAVLTVEGRITHPLLLFGAFIKWAALAGQYQDFYRLVAATGAAANVVQNVAADSERVPDVVRFLRRGTDVQTAVDAAQILSRFDEQRVVGFDRVCLHVPADYDHRDDVYTLDRIQEVARLHLPTGAAFDRVVQLLRAHYRPPVEIRLVQLPTWDENDTLTNYALNCPPVGWEPFFRQYAPKLVGTEQSVRRVSEGKVCLPRRNLIFRAYRFLEPSRVKVVIVGQDPYPTVYDGGKSFATGLAFSIPRDAPLHQILRTLYQEVANCYPHFVKPSHGDLTSWEAQGVMLLNTCLTVNRKESRDEEAAGSHKAIWMGFVIESLKYLIAQNPKVVFLLWGQKAQSLEDPLGSRTMRLLAAHPSGRNAGGGFLGCGHFRKVNDKLTELGIEPIDWTRL